MDQVRFGRELISRLFDYLCAELNGCRGVGLVAWSGEGPGEPLMAVGVAKQRDRTAHEALLEAGVKERQVCREDVDGMGFVAVPGSWGNTGPVVLTVYLDHPPHSGDLRVIEEIEPMLTTAAAVVEFCAGEVLRADQMVAMVQHRRFIEQAKGVLMSKRQCTAGVAFQLLVRTSQNANVKLRDLCAALLLHVCGTLDETDMMPVPEPGEEATEVARQLWAALQKD